MSADEVGVPCVGNCGVFVNASGENFGSMPVAMSFRPSAGVRVQDDVEALAQASLAHVLVHDQRVGDLLVVEDHAHPARRLRVAPGLQHARAAAGPRGGASPSGARRARASTSSPRSAATLSSAERSAGLARDDPRAGGDSPCPAALKRLLGGLDLEAREPHARREERLLAGVAHAGRRRRRPATWPRYDDALRDRRELRPAARPRPRSASSRRRARPAAPTPRRRRRRRAPCRPGTSAASGGRARSRGTAGPCARRRCLWELALLHLEGACARPTSIACARSRFTSRARRRRVVLLLGDRDRVRASRLRPCARRCVPRRQKLRSISWPLRAGVLERREHARLHVVRVVPQRPLELLRRRQPAVPVRLRHRPAGVACCARRRSRARPSRRWRCRTSRSRGRCRCGSSRRSPRRPATNPSPKPQVHTPGSRIAVSVATSWNAIVCHSL